MKPESNSQEIQQDKIVESDIVSTDDAGIGTANAAADDVDRTVISTVASPPTAANDPLVGSTLGGHLKILSCLGAGGMSVVYKAEDLLLHRTVAVKILHSHSALNPQNVLRFRQEAMAASKIDHPNVIRIYEFNVPDQGQPYLVMDFIEGLSLADFIKQNGPIEMRRAISLMGIICDGLECAHDAGVVHRDLKPGNIMLLKDSTGKQTLKIVDFGIAKVLTEDSEGHALTQTGEVFGSPLYMSPEQCYGKTLDKRSDMYSIGCVMYEMCTGQPPIKGNSLLETIQLQTTDTPAPSLSIYPGIKYGAVFDAVIQRAMAKNPEERFQSALEFKQALLNILDSQAPIENNAKGEQLRKVALIGCVLAAVFLASSFFLYRSGKTPSAVGQPVPTVTPPGTPPQTTTKQPAHLKTSTNEGARCRTSTDLINLYKMPPERQPTRLDITDSVIGDNALRVIANNENLKTVKAVHSQMTDASGPTIGSLKNLERLDVAKNSIGNSFLKDISDLKEIGYFWCPNTSITKNGMGYLAKLPLHNLNVGDNPMIGDAGLAKISGLQLTELRITNTGVTGAGLKCLEKMDSLQVLLTGKNKIGNKGVQYLKKLTNLKHIGLEAAGLTDADVKELTSLKHLENINIANNRISAMSMEYLSKIPTLKVIRIVNSDITPKEALQFRQRHPNIRINEY